MNRIKIVAEIGCNHNGDFELAKKLVKAAAEAGVDAVKFQSFNAKSLVSGHAPKADYQKKLNDKESQLEMLQKLEITDSQYCELKSYAETLGLECFSTAFDKDSFNFLAGIGQRIWKIPSGEITNLPFLEAIRDLECQGKEIILSTGMSTIDEIREAVEILEGKSCHDITILHCNTEYPTEDLDMNLKAINVLKKHFPKYKIGLSDHSKDNFAAIVASGMGISFIEKHFTMDKGLLGPDHKASITPAELTELCNDVRRSEVILGEERKYVTESENKNKFVARKSIVASCDIKKGELFSKDNITCKRPGYGISPMNWYKLIGKTAEKDFLYDELIKCSDISWENKNE